MTSIQNRLHSKISHIFWQGAHALAKQADLSLTHSVAAEVERQYPDLARLIERVKPYTMTSTERMFALHQAMRYVSASGVPGSIVECGVWRGGSAMLAALTLMDLGETERAFYLYDTFEGMTAPTERDLTYSGAAAIPRWEAARRGDGSDWCCASLDDVRANFTSTGYPAERVHYVQGKVEDTLPETLPDEIALLRLDTDWYASTKHELVHLYPRLARGGVLIIDDYGHWEGARQAVDEYFAETGQSVLLNRIDYSARLAVKM